MSVCAHVCEHMTESSYLFRSLECHQNQCAIGSFSYQQVFRGYLPQARPGGTTCGTSAIHSALLFLAHLNVFCKENVRHCPKRKATPLPTMEGGKKWELKSGVTAFS